jgi:hypothetical protein
VRVWKVLRTVCRASGHLGPWRRSVFFRSSTSCGSRALTILAVRALRGFLECSSASAAKLRRSTYISRNMAASVELESKSCNCRELQNCVLDIFFCWTLSYR